MNYVQPTNRILIVPSDFELQKTKESLETRKYREKIADIIDEEKSNDKEDYLNLRVADKNQVESEMIYMVTVYNEDLYQLGSSFSSGKIYIDKILEGKDKFSKTIANPYVIVECKKAGNIFEPAKIAGFFSLNADAIIKGEHFDVIKALGDKNHKNDLIVDGKAFRISMFAVDQEYQDKYVVIDGVKKSFTTFQLFYCIEAIKHITEKYVGGKYITVWASKEGFDFFKSIGNFEEIILDGSMLSYSEGYGKCIPMYRTIRSENEL
ncbi:MAG: hypothetical protein LUG21_07500 [Clostridiales bacterium]|nr:hypothetical protein [Clostridiales bacterium]